ncbi:hypothetical protein Q4Q35_05465 [Flavivirga aquimarina]|uniref:Uncharacterized protein n=1 Tax=Flavivirga aquimarina TaxID=2027862 RepID=A0ABT8W7Z5_9FLAO|nr:hypothetical protein [Flavivirga aquimarina]MDO5969250.1 hypothetical protein [Flavivirga aquimarina]
MDYIINTYCVNKEKVELACNGKCHLAKQLQIESKNQEDNKAVQLFTEFFSLVFYQKNAPYNLIEFIEHQDRKMNSANNQIYTYTFGYKHFRPPLV